ncbi:MAG: hypothetical protein IJB96_10710 [Lachnospira sp.]|nr:hypothetical protein [Lachnospira sp.]
MKFFNKLERRFGKYAISNLMYYIIGLYVVGFILNLFAPGFYAQYLSLSVEKILQGQVWRLVTYIIEPPSTSLIFAVFTLYFYYLIGNNLERIWGAFRFNLYYFSGVILHIVAAFLIYFIFGLDFSMTTYYINLALFMAFAMEYGETVVYLFFFLPIKIKWLAYLDGAIFALTIIGGFPAYLLAAYLPGLYIGLSYAGIMLHPVYATCALISMINFLVFFFMFKKGPAKSQAQKNYKKAMDTAMKAEKKRQQEEARNHEQFDGQQSGNASKSRGHIVFHGAARHKCAVCGRTENDGDLTFRYCSKCEGDYEYCQDHLYTHIHVTK